MGLIKRIQRSYQRNIANGELRKHKGMYAALFLGGMLVQMTMCNAAPYNAPRQETTVQTIAAHETYQSREYQAASLERLLTCHERVVTAYEQE